MGRIFDDSVTFVEGEMVVEREGIQETITTSDTKQFFSTAINQFFMTDNENADRQWEQVFRVIPGKGHGELLPFRPPDVTTTISGATGGGGNAITVSAVGSHGIVFNEVGEGGEIKFSRVVSAEKYVKHIKYGTAIGYSNEWFSDGSMALIEMVTEDFREAADDMLAAIHYGAIAAAVNASISTSTALDGTGTAGVARVLNTLNTITSAMRRNKRRPSHFIIAPENEAVVRLALKVTQEGGSVAAVQNEFVKRLDIIVTDFAVANTGYVVEAKRRLISTNRLALSLGNFQDLLRDGETLVGKFRRGVLVGEGQCINAFTSIPQDLVSTDDF